MDRLWGTEVSVAEGLAAGNQANAQRAAADARVEEAIRSKRLIVDGAPDGYILCLDCGDGNVPVQVPGIDPETGEWLRGGGSCPECLKRRGIHPDQRKAAARAVGAQREVDGSQLPSDPSSVVRHGAESPAATDDAQAVRGETRLVPVGLAEVVPGAPAPTGVGGASSADPWDDVFGFPAGELRA